MVILYHEVLKVLTNAPVEICSKSHLSGPHYPSHCSGWSPQEWYWSCQPLFWCHSVCSWCQWPCHWLKLPSSWLHQLFYQCHLIWRKMKRNYELWQDYQSNSHANPTMPWLVLPLLMFFNWSSASSRSFWRVFFFSLALCVRPITSVRLFAASIWEKQELATELLCCFKNNSSKVGLTYFWGLSLPCLHSAATHRPCLSGLWLFLSGAGCLRSKRRKKYLVKVKGYSQSSYSNIQFDIKLDIIPRK